jgi:hypothetical protein
MSLTNDDKVELEQTDKSVNELKNELERRLSIELKVPIEVDRLQYIQKRRENGFTNLGTSKETKINKKRQINHETHESLFTYAFIAQRERLRAKIIRDMIVENNILPADFLKDQVPTRNELLMLNLLMNQKKRHNQNQHGRKSPRLFASFGLFSFFTVAFILILYCLFT